MNNISTSFISDPNTEQPFTGPSLAFLQQIIADGFKAAIYPMLGPLPYSTIPFALYGLENEGAYPNVTFSGGAIFYGGQYYNVPAASFTVTGSNIAGGVITTTNPSPDPVTFSDGTTKNVHNVTQMVFQNIAPGTGVIPYSDVVFPFLDLYYNGIPNMISVGSGGIDDPGWASGYYYNAGDPLRLWRNEITGTVTVQGYISSGSASWGGAIFANPLSSNLRPAYDVYLVFVDDTYVLTVLHIDTSGNAYILRNGSSGSFAGQFYINTTYSVL